jgi:hypothetical protein
MPKKFAILALLLLLLSACQNNSNLAITIQTEQTITNDKLTLNVSTSDGKNHQVELLKNGEVFKRLSAPFSYVWDTSKEAEGEYAFQARVDRVTSDKLMLTVDRSAPAITKSLPLETHTNVKLSNPITIQFSEAVDPATLESAIHLMSDDDALEKDFSLSADGRTLTITPTANTLSFPATRA